MYKPKDYVGKLETFPFTISIFIWAELWIIVAFYFQKFLN